MKTFSSNNNLDTVPEVTPAELARAFEAGDRIQIIDVRRPSSIAPVGLMPPGLNIVGSTLLGYTDLGETGVDASTPAVVICARGNDSRVAAHHLNRLGAHAQSLAGGMTAWMKLSVPRTVTPPPSLDRLVQFDRVGKEALSYVLISAGEALIIDPPRDADSLLRYIDDEGATLVGVADTHVHADYISGATAIARARGVPYYLHPYDSVFPYDGTQGSVEFQPISDGMSIRCGRCPMMVVHTPGHSPGSVTYIVKDTAAFTGDFLFITSIGRPDLADRTEEWSALLWTSIQRAKSQWPSTLMIYPAHYTSQTARTGDGVIGEPFGSLLVRNPSLGISSESSFMHWIEQHVASFPDAYRTIKGINVGLFSADDREADELENGRNECALGG